MSVDIGMSAGTAGVAVNRSIPSCQADATIPPSGEKAAEKEQSTKPDKLPMACRVAAGTDRGAAAGALPRVAADNARRAAIAARYRNAARDVRWPAPNERHVYHLCVGRVADREEFRARVQCATAVHYPRALTQCFFYPSSGG